MIGAIDENQQTTQTSELRTCKNHSHGLKMNWRKDPQSKNANKFTGGWPFAMAEMAMSLFAMATSARDSLLLCGPTIFSMGDAACIRQYTTGMSQLAKLMQRLEVGRDLGLLLLMLLLLGLAGWLLSFPGGWGCCGCCGCCCCCCCCCWGWLAGCYPFLGDGAVVVVGAGFRRNLGSHTLEFLK